MLKTKLLLLAVLWGCLSIPALAKPKLEFGDLDLDKNGGISLKEVLSTAQARFKKADSNKDQMITVDEILELMPFYVRPMAKGKVQTYLKERDLNKDGKTHLKEIEDFTTKRFKGFDKNGDGQLSAAEFNAVNLEL